VVAVAVVLFPATPAAAESLELCRFDGGKLAEISGLATSALHSGIVWAHNDSEGGSKLYAVDTGTCEIRSILRVRGIAARDPEAIAVGIGTSGAPAIFWGDIGDNTAERRYLEIHEITEPADLIDTTVTPTTYRVRLDEPEDAEALVADGDQLWMISKGLVGGTVWQLPRPLTPDDVARARAVGIEDALVTDAAMRPGGGYAVRDYSEVRIYSGAPPGELIERMPLPEQIQGEAMTWTADGTALILASEGDDRLLRVQVTSPDEPTEVAPTESTTTPTIETALPEASSVASPQSEESQLAPSQVAQVLAPVDRVGSLAVLALAIGAGVFIVSAAAVPVFARLRSRR
jgi:hypothetical protein